MARGTAAGELAQFSGVSRNALIMSSMKQSDFPSGHGGGSSARGRAAPNCTSDGRCLGAGTMCCIGLWHTSGFRDEQWTRSFARSVTISDVVHQAGGHPDPPNDKRNSR